MLVKIPTYYSIITLVLWCCLINQTYLSGVFEIRLISFENYRGIDATGSCCREETIKSAATSLNSNFLTSSRDVNSPHNNHVSSSEGGEFENNHYYKNTGGDGKGDDEYFSHPLLHRKKCTSGSCNTYFTVCLKHYQASVSKNVNRHHPDNQLIDSLQMPSNGIIVPVRNRKKRNSGNLNLKMKPTTKGVSSFSTSTTCTFGSFMTPLLGGNSFFNHDHVYSLPFSFSWPGTFSLVIEAWHNNTFEEFSSHMVGLINKDADASSHQEEQKLIAKLETQKSAVADGKWTQDSHVSTHTKLKYAYRIVCDRHYYGKNCANLCRPRDDKFGHYVCGRSGQKICKQGWTGPYCTKAICARGCHSEHGFCDLPGECKCRLGYKGKYCEDCIRYPGCLHGTCHQPWQCNCKDGWGGLFCNQDLNYCTNHKPCKNGGICTNSGQGSFTCTCPKGYLGTTCEIEISKCDPSLCLNDGTCRLEGNLNFSCECLPGFLGHRCQTNTFTCADKPCQGNNSTCLDLYDGGYKCLCPKERQGVMCHIRKTKCPLNNTFANKCQNGGQCIMTTEIVGIIKNTTKYSCMCPLGFIGSNCEIDINATLSQSDMVVQGKHKTAKNVRFNNIYSDSTNKTNLNKAIANKIMAREIGDNDEVTITINPSKENCDINPCQNGGICYERGSNSFVCRCQAGFTGSLCQIDVPDCASNPCGNGGTCTDLINDYACSCPLGFEGKDCTVNVDECLIAEQLFARRTVSEPPCDNNGTCIDRVNGYECKCPTDFYGDRCQFFTGSLVKISGLWNSRRGTGLPADLAAIKQVITDDLMLNKDLDNYDLTAAGAHHQVAQALKMAHEMGVPPSYMENNGIGITPTLRGRMMIENLNEGNPNSSHGDTITTTNSLTKFLTKTEVIMITCLSISFVTVTFAIIGILCVYKKKLFAAGTSNNLTDHTSDDSDITGYRVGRHAKQALYDSNKKYKSSNNNKMNHRNIVSSHSFFTSGRSGGKGGGGTGLPRNDLRIPSTIEETSEISGTFYSSNQDSNLCGGNSTRTTNELPHGGTADFDNNAGTTLLQMTGLSEEEYYKTLDKLGAQEIYNQIKSNIEKKGRSTSIYNRNSQQQDSKYRNSNLYGMNKSSVKPAVVSSSVLEYKINPNNILGPEDDESCSTRSDIVQIFTDHETESNTSNANNSLEKKPDYFYRKASSPSIIRPPTYDQSQQYAALLQNSPDNKSNSRKTYQNTNVSYEDDRVLQQHETDSDVYQLESSPTKEKKSNIDCEKIYNEPHHHNKLNNMRCARDSKNNDVNTLTERLIINTPIKDCNTRFENKLLASLISPDRLIIKNSAAVPYDDYESHEVLNRLKESHLEKQRIQNQQNEFFNNNNNSTKYPSTLLTYSSTPYPSRDQNQRQQESDNLRKENQTPNKNEFLSIV